MRRRQLHPERDRDYPTGDIPHHLRRFRGAGNFRMARAVLRTGGVVGGTRQRLDRRDFVTMQSWVLVVVNVGQSLVTLAS